MQENTSNLYQGTYLSQPFNSFAIYPDSFDEFKESRIGQILIADIPSRIKESQLKIWKEIVNMDFLTKPLSDSIKVADILYHLRPQVNSQWGYSQERTDMHHAFVRLAELWRKFKEVLERWGKTEVGAHGTAADGLFRLEEARFLPVLARFRVVLQGCAGPGLVEELEEFVTTSMTLIQRIEVWLREVGRRA